MNDTEKRAILLKDIEQIHKELLDITKDISNLEVRESKAAKDRVVGAFNRVRLILDETEQKL